MTFPQLRVRTEFSFRSAYGPISSVTERLESIGASAAAIVDTSGTWGAVQWELSLSKTGVKPLFGADFRLKDQAARYWAIARDLAAFYRFSSNPPETVEELKARKDGLVVFAGAALTDPDAFDYIDINPRSRLRTRHALELAEQTGKLVVVTSDNNYPGPEDRNRFLAWDDSKKMTPQHILNYDEMRMAFSYLPSDIFDFAIQNTIELADSIPHLTHKKAPIISVPGDLASLVESGKQYRIERGLIWSSEYETRLARELELIKQKRFDSYFLVVADLVTWAKTKMLVGPGRGSAAGSLVCYLLRITELDPLVHGLLFERFIDINRADLPDIDIDFNDQKRETVFEYLAQKYGDENTARIGSINRLKPRSAAPHVAKRLGLPVGSWYSVLNVLIEHNSGDERFGKSLEDTFEKTAPGAEFLKRFPEARLMAEIEETASHTGVHAAGFIVSNEPVTEYCTVRDGIAQIDKKEAEYLNLLKIDVLGLRTLGVIEDSGVVTNDCLYSLPLNDPEVFRIFNEHKYSGVFQFEGAAQRVIAEQIPITDFRQIDHITALARPGPMAGGAVPNYINRNLEIKHPSLTDTHGVILYQEQVMAIVKDLGGFTWEETSEIRKAVSKSKGAEYLEKWRASFLKGGGTNELWDEIITFGSYGMNRAHTASYAVVSYWCAFMKRYHGIEFAAAILRNAKDDEQTTEVLRELSAEGVGFIPFDPELSGRTWEARGGKLIGGFTNLIGIGPAKSEMYVQKRAAGKLTDKDRETLSKLKCKHEDLTPAHTLFGDIYRNPQEYDIYGPVKQFAELTDAENAVVICRLIEAKRRDENEAARMARRNGQSWRGESLFLDAMVVDDSITKPVILRLKTNQWRAYGEKIADRAVPKQEYFLVRGKYLKQFSMFTVEKIKCLTNGNLFD